MSDSVSIWCQLCYKRQGIPIGQASKLKTLPNDDIDDLKKKVIQDSGNNLKHCHPRDLLVYPPGTILSANENQSIRADVLCSSIIGVTYDNPLIVVAPTPPYPAGNSPVLRTRSTDSDSPDGVPQESEAKRQRAGPREDGEDSGTNMNVNDEQGNWLARVKVGDTKSKALERISGVGPGVLIDKDGFGLLDTDTINEESGPYVFKRQPQQDGASTKRQRTSLDRKKEKLDCGDGLKKFGELQDRDCAKKDLEKGLQFLATGRGKTALDKKDVPVLAISAPSESGKTEFLKWIFNNCCTFNDDAGDYAKNVLLGINDASINAPPLDRLLVLFASFNQTSTYDASKEKDIVHSTIERLLRSFEGRLDMRGFDTKAQLSWDNLVDMFSKNDEKIGFVICLDELSMVRTAGIPSEHQYNTLMDSVLTFSQYMISKGGYFAVVGSSLHIYDFGEVVLRGSTRAMLQIKFPPDTPMIEKKTRTIVQENLGTFNATSCRQQDDKFRLEVAIQVAKSSPRMSEWLGLANCKTKIRIPDKLYNIPDGIDASYVFKLAARTALGGVTDETSYNKKELNAVLHKLHGSAKLRGAEENHKYVDWANVQVALSLPPYRLLQLNFTREDFMVPHVQNWVLVELRRLLYHDSKSEIYRTWELGAIAILELRKAMLLAVRDQTASVRDQTVSLRVIVGEVSAFLKVRDDILDKPATQETASIEVCANLPSASDPCQRPCVYYSSNPCEKGVEGVFRGGFEDLAIFFQMKLYKEASPKQIKQWLCQAHDRASTLGYEKDTYIVQLFVTGTISDNVDSYKNDWPDGSVVFAGDAIRNLFKPFGHGVFSAMVNLRRREIGASK